MKKYKYQITAQIVYNNEFEIEAESESEALELLHEKWVHADLKTWDCVDETYDAELMEQAARL